MEESFNPISRLKGMRLRIFSYLLQISGEVGIRETQRALGLKTPSHANYHLNKLLEDGICYKTSEGKFGLIEKYKIKSVEVAVLTEYFLLNGKFFPKFAYYASLMAGILIVSIFLALINNQPLLVFFLIISLLFVSITSILEIKKQLSALPEDLEFGKFAKMEKPEENSK